MASSSEEFNSDSSLSDEQDLLHLLDERIIQCVYKKARAPADIMASRNSSLGFSKIEPHQIWTEWERQFRKISRKIDAIRRRFLWNGVNRGNARPHLVKWENICLPKSAGGQGAMDLEVMNKALLAKWVWRWATQPTLWWVMLFKERKAAGATTCHCQSSTHVFNLAENKGSKEGECWSEENDWILNLRRITTEVEVQELVALLATLHGIQCNPREENAIVWGPQPTSTFTLKACYVWWRRGQSEVTGMVVNTPWIWKCKIPLKSSHAHKAALWAVWKSRNKKLFTGQRFYLENIWGETVYLIKSWGCSLAGAQHVELIGGVFQIDPD
ncbi:hypothetical protein QJS10_CPB21g01370 [Acorus calamus]|uniref:Uncharacterized protein n=1 Tax=Acorus calamus TaxID=4465 RepID=A0AAV9C7J8_ACOCL|nr:hypothetical protein QJS10_CPB21g01370 [Acorus calamus]